eukprot:6179503-Pleurochrysis_carterae.AAC.2
MNEKIGLHQLTAWNVGCRPRTAFRFISLSRWACWHRALVQNLSIRNCDDEVEQSGVQQTSGMGMSASHRQEFGCFRGTSTRISVYTDVRGRESAVGYVSIYMGRIMKGTFVAHDTQLRFRYS